MANTVTRLKVGDKAPTIQVLDTQGRSVQLGAPWSNGLTLVSFLRHFGCIHCRARLSVLEKHRAELNAAGMYLVTLALGQAKHAARYCGKLAPHLDCYASPDNEGYYAWGLRQGTASELLSHGLDVMKASAKAFVSGHMQGTATGDANMLPGTFIVDQNGVIQYAYYSKYAGDDPSIETLVEVAQSLRAAAN